MEQVKLLSMTVVLTVLIWASADSLVNEAVTISVAFNAVPAPGAGDMLVQAVTPDETYEIVVSGPRKLVEDVQTQSMPLNVRLRIEDQPTGPVTISLDRAKVKEMLAARWSEFHRLTLVSIQPATLEVEVDHWVRREAEIVARRFSLAFDVEPQLRQTSTSVRMRESAMAGFTPDQTIQIDITADIERLLKEQPAGESVTVPVTLDSRPYGPDATLRPAVVEVTATTKAQRRTARIPTVPVLVAFSFANLEKSYRAVTRDGSPLSLVTRTIEVTGPIEAVARLERGTTRVYGLIHLKQEDLEQVDVPRLRTPEYRLPDGVVLSEEPAPVEFKLIPAVTAENRP